MTEPIKDPVKRIDELIDHILKYPEMHGADTIQTLECLLMALLALRQTWAPVPDMVPWRSVYGKWAYEYFNDKSPNNCASFGRLVNKFGWERGDTYRDHEDTWPDVIEFYKELVWRTREAANWNDDDDVWLKLRRSGPGHHE
jgi:hypothetical protein